MQDFNELREGSSSFDQIGKPIVTPVIMLRKGRDNNRVALRTPESSYEDLSHRLQIIMQDFNELREGSSSFDQIGKPIVTPVIMANTFPAGRNYVIDISSRGQMRSAVNMFFLEFSQPESAKNRVFSSITIHQSQATKKSKSIQNHSETRF